MIKSIVISEDTHSELLREQGQLQQATGKRITMDLLIKEMIIIWRKKR